MFQDHHKMFLFQLTLLIICSHIIIIAANPGSCSININSKYAASAQSHPTKAKVINIDEKDDLSFEVNAATYDSSADEYDYKNTVTISSFKNTRQCKHQIRPGYVYTFSLIPTQHSGKFLSVTEPDLVHSREKRRASRQKRKSPHDVAKEGIAGDQLKLKCQHSGKIVWFKNGDKLAKRSKVRSKYRDEHIKVNKSGSVLTFQSLSVVNNGVYTCRVTGKDHSKTEKVFNVSVLQCSADENQCSNSFCYDKGLCCESPHSPAPRCICFSSYKGYRCNQFTPRVRPVENVDDVKSSLPFPMIIGISCFTVLILGSVLIIFICTRKDGEERNEEEEDSLSNYDDNTIETLT